MSQEAMDLDDAFDLAMFDALANSPDESKSKSVGSSTARKAFHSRPKKAAARRIQEDEFDLSAFDAVAQEPESEPEPAPARTARYKVESPVRSQPSCSTSYSSSYQSSTYQSSCSSPGKRSPEHSTGYAFLLMFKLLISLALIALGVWAIYGVGQKPYDSLLSSMVTVAEADIHD